MVVGHNTICGTCFAKRGRYRHSEATVATLQARFEWTKGCMRTPEGVQEFISTLVAAIRYTQRPHFRIHESGDFFSEVYVRAWTDICRQLPEFRFWGPTRSYRMSWLPALVELNALPNVAIRPSALHFDDPPPVVPGLAAGMTSVDHDYTCPAPDQGHTCGTCRNCWEQPDLAVSFVRVGKRRQPAAVGA